MAGTSDGVGQRQLAEVIPLNAGIPMKAGTIDRGARLEHDSEALRQGRRRQDRGTRYCSGVAGGRLAMKLELIRATLAMAD